MLMKERGTGVSSLPLNTECHLLGIKYRPEYPAINIILQLIVYTEQYISLMLGI